MKEMYMKERLNQNSERKAKSEFGSNFMQILHSLSMIGKPRFDFEF